LTHTTFLVTLDTHSELFYFTSHIAHEIIYLAAPIHVITYPPFASPKLTTFMRQLPTSLHRWLKPFVFAMTSVLSLACLAQTPGTNAAAEPAAVEIPIVCPPEFVPPSQAQLPEKLANAKDKGFLYAVSKNGATSWLYGTIHIGNEDSMVPSRTLITTLLGAKAFALELDPTDTSPLLAALSEYKGQALNRALSTEKRIAMMEHLAKQSCSNVDALRALPILMQALALSLQAAKYVGLHTEAAQEFIIAGVAQATGKKIHALETINQQLDALSGKSVADGNLLLDDFFNTHDDPKNVEKMQALMNLWLAGDEAKLNSYFDWCECAETAAEQAQFKRLLAERNVGLIQNAIQLHEQYAGGVFIAVGSLHLIGESGFIKGLETAGYTIKRL
jgi:uncharacterized protein